MRKELKASDVLVFNKESGSGSFVKVVGKGNYFMPAKKGLRLEGNKKPIVRNEKFVYIDYEVLKRESPRTVRIGLVRVLTGEKCYISENDLDRYFIYSQDQSLHGFKRNSIEDIHGER